MNRTNSRSPLIWYLAVLAILLAYISLIVPPFKLNAVGAIAQIFNPVAGDILWAVKLPRMLLTISAAIVLAVSGSIFQGILGNRRGAANYVIWMILAACLSLFAALLFTIYYLGMSPNVWLWFLGGFSTAGWHKLLFLAPVLFLALLVAVFYYRDLNALLLGEDVASTLGVYVNAIRVFLLTSAALMAAGGIFVMGLSGIVLLIAPYFIKIWLGANYKSLFPVSVFFVISMTLIADILSRVSTLPEIPAGLLLLVAGAPFIIYIFWARRSM